MAVGGCGLSWVWLWLVHKTEECDRIAYFVQEYMMMMMMMTVMMTTPYCLVYYYINNNGLNEWKKKEMRSSQLFTFVVQLSLFSLEDKAGNFHFK